MPFGTEKALMMGSGAAVENYFGDANIYILPINVAFEKQEEFEKQILNYVENNKRNS